MLKLDQIQKGAAISGLEPGQVVRIVTTEPVGDNALTVYNKTLEGKLLERMLFRTDEAKLSLAEAGRPWAFDAPGEGFKLAAEAYRIHLAHLFDPMMAVHTSNVEPLPHQLRQADLADPGSVAAADRAVDGRRPYGGAACGGGGVASQGCWYGRGTSTTAVTTGGDETPRVEDSAEGGYQAGGGAAGQSAKKRFYGSIELDPFLAKRQFADLVDEVIQQFTLRPGVKVKIAVEIEAESATGFDDRLQRAVKENCNVLRFKNAEFEAGE